MGLTDLLHLRLSPDLAATGSQETRRFRALLRAGRCLTRIRRADSASVNPLLPDVTLRQKKSFNGFIRKSETFLKIMLVY